jgi:alanine dehydrogenase
VPRTSTYALNNATLPFVMQIAEKGAHGALNSNPHLARGLTVADGMITHAAVARDLGMAFSTPTWFDPVA